MKSASGVSPTWKRKRLAEIVRFVLVGALNTLFGFLAYSGLVLLHLPIWIALGMASLCAIAFNFFTIGGIVFRDLVMARLPRFCSAYLLLLGLNYLALRELRPYLGQDAILTQAVLTAPMAIISYLAMSLFVFRGRLPA